MVKRTTKGVTNQLHAADFKGRTLVQDVKRLGEALANQGASDELLQELRETYKLLAEGAEKLTAIYQAHGGRV
jgi:hypothetical protein